MLIAVFFVLSGIAAVLVCEGALHPQRRSLTADVEQQAVKEARYLDAQLEDLAISAQDGALLKAWAIHPERPNKQVVILLHGLSDNRAGMAGYAKILLRHHFMVLMPDARAHGSSQGNLATYGLLEAEDIRRWHEWLVKTEHPDCVFAMGESMGAAQLLQSLPAKLAFCAVAAESPFATFEEVAFDRMGQRFGTGPWLGRTLLRPLVGMAFSYAHWKYGLDLKQVSPQQAVLRTRVPVLLIHGEIDSNIPLRHSRMILASHRSNVVLWEVPETDHTGTISTHPEELENRLVAWFESHNKPHSAKRYQWGRRQTVNS